MPKLATNTNGEGEDLPREVASSSFRRQLLTSAKRASANSHGPR